MNKRLYLIFVVFLVLFAFAACGNGGTAETSDGSDGNAQTGDGDKIKIGFSFGTMTEERWVQEKALAEEYAKEHDIELIALSADDDAANQMSQCENMITQGVDVLLIAAKDAESIGAICDIAHKEGVKVVAYERLVNNGDTDYYCAFDSVAVGEIEAQMLVDVVPKGNYIWLHGGPEDNNTYLYMEGNQKILQPYIDSGDIKIVADQFCNGWSADLALSHTENALSANDNDIQAVLAPNDTTAGAAIQALTAQNLAGKVPVSGQDGDVAACQRIVEGTQTGTAFKYLPALTNAAMDFAVKVAKGDEDSVSAMINGSTNNGFKDVDSVFIPLIWVNKDNINETIIASGFHTIEEVYKSIDENEWPTVEVTGTIDFEKYAYQRQE